MGDLIEEYGFIIVSTICALLLFAGFTAGLEHDGFLGKAVIDFVKSLIGG